MDEYDHRRRGNLELVSDRLWEIDSEYETLKDNLDDTKLLLSALKQQSDLLSLISKLNIDDSKVLQETEPQVEPSVALQKLKELFAQLMPVLVD